ncbi:MAG: hypothetical protein ABJQ71_12285 [Roseibium sp.]
MRPGNDRAVIRSGAMWGFAEATLFFIVPDVLLTSLALNSFRKAVLAALAAAMAATIGGLLVWLGAHWFPVEIKAVLLAVPGISENTFSSVQALLKSGAFSGMLQGAFSGMPYKIFAAEAGSTDINPVLFAILTPIARLPRFLLLSVAAWTLSWAVGTRMATKSKLRSALVLWCVFYFGYFSVIGW